MAGKLEVGEGSGVERMECSHQKNREGENTGREIEGRKKIEEECVRRTEVEKWKSVEKEEKVGRKEKNDTLVEWEEERARI